jgi:hypothetical protein
LEHIQLVVELSDRGYKVRNLLYKYMLYKW